MDWTQLISLAGYTTGACYFFYRLNEKSIEKSEKRHEESIQKLENRFEKNEEHWRDMFKHFNARLDKITDKK